MVNIPAVEALKGKTLGAGDDLIASCLGFVRSHLDMEVAYLSEFIGDNLIFRAVDAPGLEDMIEVGDTMPLDQVYCRHILAGRLPELIPDTAVVPFAQKIAITHALPIRSHVSVPIRRPDGSAFGMFCCLSRRPRSNLDKRDHDVMRAFAALSAEQVNSRVQSDADLRKKRGVVEHVLGAQKFEIALQPILKLQDPRIAGYEALCRFSPEPYRPPNVWFDDAAEVGLQQELELGVIDVALNLLPDLDAACYLAVNTSPQTLSSGEIAPLLEKVDGKRVVVEITEHDAIEDLSVLLVEIDRLREMGVRIAIDDAGAGYSGLQQIIRLRPNVIKLDMSLTKDVDKDVARRSLAAAMVQFARDTEAKVVAEGIETEAEMRTLAQLGVEMGQGYHLGRPTLAADVLRAAKSA